jgi:hypothetical protein
MASFYVRFNISVALGLKFSLTIDNSAWSFMVFPSHSKYIPDNKPLPTIFLLLHYSKPFCLS